MISTRTQFKFFINIEGEKWVKANLDTIVAHIIYKHTVQSNYGLKLLVETEHILHKITK